MLRSAAHQVAGHEAGVGKVGPLIDGAGKFYKPLQDGERGAREKKFYEEFWADKDVPASVKAFFPCYYGTTEAEVLDGSGFIDHVVLEDLTHQFSQPSVMDLKMGVRTWYAGASDQYVAKCIKKDAESTSKELGFRVSGLQAFDASNGKAWKPGRVWCKMLDVDATKTLLKQFVSSNPTDDVNPDLAYASAVYGCSGGIINQLSELRSWFAMQTNYHFFSSSILLMYESDCTSLSSQENMCGCVKLVDFAHVLTGQGAVDDNFLKGLNSLIDILSEIAGQS
eukprot:c23231_g1_i1 orf=382-1224(+)